MFRDSQSCLNPMKTSGVSRAPDGGLVVVKTRLAEDGQAVAPRFSGISPIVRPYGVSSTPGPLMGKASPCLATRVASLSNASSLAWDSVELVAFLLSDLPLSVQFAIALKTCALGGWYGWLGLGLAAAGRSTIRTVILIASLGMRRPGSFGV